MVYRNIEESLNLVCMKVHCDKTVDTCYTKKVSYKLGTDRNTWFVLAVLTSPTEIWDYSDNALC